MPATGRSEQRNDDTASKDSNCGVREDFCAGSCAMLASQFSSLVRIGEDSGHALVFGEALGLIDENR